MRWFRPMIEELEGDVCDSFPLLERNCSCVAVSLLEGMGGSVIETRWFMCLSLSRLLRIMIQGKQQG